MMSQNNTTQSNNSSKLRRATIQVYVRDSVKSDKINSQKITELVAETVVDKRVNVFDYLRQPASLRDSVLECNATNDDMPLAICVKLENIVKDYSFKQS
ncbi:hypothetical protein MP228_010868 [Amoeboaphelidium protococcarum]|nr:hypothetical protein MP228_010868 [Amoeboaphelidium protococcarum]